MIAKTKDGRNILYDANVKIKEGISIDKNATSLRAKKNAEQAVKVPKPSKTLYQKDKDLSRKTEDIQEVQVTSVQALILLATRRR